jgi:hypothetical protein
MQKSKTKSVRIYGDGFFGSMKNGILGATATMCARIVTKWENIVTSP